MNIENISGETYAQRLQRALANQPHTAENITAADRIALRSMVDEIHLMLRTLVQHHEEALGLSDDSARIDFIAQELIDEADGSELYPVGADVEFDDTGNVVTKVNSWHWLGHTGATFREALDKAMAGKA